MRSSTPVRPDKASASACATRGMTCRGLVSGEVRDSSSTRAIDSHGEYVAISSRKSADLPGKTRYRVARDTSALAASSSIDNSARLTRPRRSSADSRMRSRAPGGGSRSSSLRRASRLPKCRYSWRSEHAGGRGELGHGERWIVRERLAGGREDRVPCTDRGHDTIIDERYRRVPATLPVCVGSPRWSMAAWPLPVSTTAAREVSVVLYAPKRYRRRSLRSTSARLVFYAVAADLAAMRPEPLPAFTVDGILRGVAAS